MHACMHAAARWKRYHGMGGVRESAHVLQAGHALRGGCAPLGGQGSLEQVVAEVERAQGVQRGPLGGQAARERVVGQVDQRQALVAGPGRRQRAWFKRGSRGDGSATAHAVWGMQCTSMANQRHTLVGAALACQRVATAQI